VWHTSFKRNSAAYLFQGWCFFLLKLLQNASTGNPGFTHEGIKPFFRTTIPCFPVKCQRPSRSKLAPEGRQTTSTPYSSEYHSSGPYFATRSRSVPSGSVCQAECSFTTHNKEQLLFQYIIPHNSKARAFTELIRATTIITMLEQGEIPQRSHNICKMCRPK
jgi:hypothetical protein